MFIAVYGDVLIDQYIYGTSERLSPEAPVPVIKFDRKETRAGGAGNVFNNINSIYEFCGLQSSSSNLPVKQRIYANGHYVTRVDYEDTSTVWDHFYVESTVSVVSDYNKGAISTLDFSKLSGKIIVDPKGSLSKYKGVWCLKPNFSEFKEYYTGNLEADMFRARNELGVEHLIVTLGKDGVAYYGDRFVKFESEAVEVFDVTGAGDTFTAVLAVSIAEGNDMITAIRKANKAAGIAVKHHGCYVIRLEDIQEPPVVFTNGCFDILHPGHIHLLNECKKMGKVIVGLNSDQSVKRLKGDSRPVVPQEQRKQMLESLGFEVRIFDEDTPLALINSIKPNIIVKGGDYSPTEVVGYGLAEVVIIPFQNGYSSTNIIKRIRND